MSEPKEGLANGCQLAGVVCLSRRAEEKVGFLAGDDGSEQFGDEGTEVYVVAFRGSVTLDDGYAPPGSG